MICRHCGSDLKLKMLDLGTCPPSNSYLPATELDAPEKWYPLRVMVCTECWLVQTADFVDREECFSSTYAYFSSCSSSWVEHARRYAASMVERFKLNSSSRVLEVAANDGYLLQHFLPLGIPCYGIEPTESTAAVARLKGIEIIGQFFSLAFEMLSPTGVVTIEFPHLLQLLNDNYFDTIYHEHFSYLSLHSSQSILHDAGLEIFDIEELTTHGGSLRIYARRSDGILRERELRVDDFLLKEKEAGILNPEIYHAFPKRAEKVKDDLLTFLLKIKAEGKSIAGYGAAAKGNTLLNYSGIRNDLLPYVVDRSPGKIGTFLPGSRIPVYEETKLKETQPDFVILMPWNLRQEITEQLDYIREWRGKFVVALPKLEVF